MLISQSEYAKRKGVSRAYINKLVKQGKIPNTGGKIDPDVADRATEQNRERPVRVPTAPPSRPARETQDGAPSLIQAKTVRETYLAKREKLRYEKQIGQVASIADVERVVSGHNATVRTRLLSMPTKLAPRILSCKTVKEVHDLLEKEVHEALTELAAMKDIGAIRE